MVCPVLRVATDSFRGHELLKSRHNTRMLTNCCTMCRRSRGAPLEEPQRKNCHGHETCHCAARFALMLQRWMLGRTLGAKFTAPIADHRLLVDVLHHASFVALLRRFPVHGVCEGVGSWPCWPCSRWGWA